MNEVVVLARAEGELFERYEWLGDRETGKGAKFDADVSEAMHMLSRHPAIASRYKRTGYRCYRLRRWKFGLFYAIEGSRVVIGAALDLRQDPENIRRRLGLR